MKINLKNTKDSRKPQKKHKQRNKSIIFNLEECLSANQMR